MNVLKFESRSKGGRGKKGGLSEYARRVGKSQQYVSQLKLAAEVANAKPTSQLVGLRDKTQHLLAFHRLPQELWPDCVDVLIDQPGLAVVKRNETIFDMWLACFTQQEIADATGVTQQAVEKAISQQTEDLPEVVKPAANHQTDFEVPIYNVWKWQTKESDLSHFGNTDPRKKTPSIERTEGAGVCHAV